MKKIVFTFGRYNPPTTGHAELINYTVSLARRTGADHRIYTSQSHDPSKNPLAPRQKIAFLRQIFPGVNFVEDSSMKTAFAICKKLADEGYEDVTFVVGSDRVDEFKTQLGKYVKSRTDKDFNPKIHYPFKKFQVVSSGARKKGISGTDLRNAVRKGDFATFAKASAAKDRALAKKIFTTTKAQLNESITRKDFHDKLDNFIDYTCKYLKIKEKPGLKYKEPSDQGEQPSFAAYSPSDKCVIIMTKNRHPMDIFRSVAHELVHHKQNEDGKLGKDVAKEGATGSPIEDEANYMAGRVMRYFARENPFYFDMNYVMEHRAILLGGVPGSGKDKVLKEAILPLGYVEVSQENFTSKDCVGDNLVINGTMAQYDQTKEIKSILESHGYKTMMVFVNTSNEVSKQRNEARSIKGGRVLSETVRFNKWKNAQDVLEKYDELFETVIEVKNDLDLNQPFDVIQRTHNKLIECVTEDVRKFTLNEADYNFENMLREMDTSRMPLSRNIQDIRSAERKADDAKLKSGEDIGNVKGPSYSWMKSPADYGSPDKPNYRYDMSSTKNYKAPIRPDNRPNIVSHDRTNYSPSTVDAVNASRDPISKAPVFKENYSDFSPTLKNNPVGGAGNWGTSKLADRYKKDTPGQEPGSNKDMKVIDFNKAPSNAKQVPMPSIPIGADRIGPEVGYPKEPTFGYNQTLPFITMYDPIGRWMVKEETRRRFKEKYGKLAEQKIRETALKLQQRESLDDPYSSFTGATPNSWEMEYTRPIGANQIDAEKQGLFGIKIRRKLKKTK